MKIRKFFKKAAAFALAAVTALSVMPATAFAAGDIGTISFNFAYVIILMLESHQFNAWEPPLIQCILKLESHHYILWSVKYIA